MDYRDMMWYCMELVCYLGKPLTLMDATSQGSQNSTDTSRKDKKTQCISNITVYDS